MNQKKSNTRKYSEEVYKLDSSNSFSTIPGSLITSTQKTNFHSLNPSYSCKCRRGYSLSSDQFNIWRRQEDQAIYSRGDIKRLFRLGGGF